MDALTVLRREHTRISQLFAEFDGLPERACVGRRALVHEIDALVRRHIQMEEALTGALEQDADHALALRLLDDVSQMDCRDDAYVERVHELREALLRHIREEKLGFPAYAEVA